MRLSHHHFVLRAGDAIMVLGSLLLALVGMAWKAIVKED